MSSSSINKKITIISCIMWGCIATFISLLTAGILLNWGAMIIISFVFVGCAIACLIKLDKLHKLLNISKAFEFPIVNTTTQPMAIPYVHPMSIPASFPASPPVIVV